MYGSVRVTYLPVLESDVAGILSRCVRWGRRNVGSGDPRARHRGGSRLLGHSRRASGSHGSACHRGAPAEAAPVATEVPVATEAASATVSAESTAEPLPEPTVVSGLPPEPDFFYGIMLPVATSDDLRDLAKVREAFQQIRSFGANVTFQVFPPEITPDEWKAYLDVAAEEGVRVIGKIGPPGWNPDPNDSSPLMNVLDVVGEHPALYGFAYLHEPWEVMNTPQMQALYKEIKATHPDTRLVIYWSGQLSRFNKRDKIFTDGLCDICSVDMKSFQNDPVLEQSQGIQRVTDGVQVIQQIDPDAQIWSLTQVWAPPNNGGVRGFRVPDPSEMKDLFCTLRREYPLKGFQWAAWRMDAPNTGTLADPQLAPQREMIKQIYDECVVNTP